MAYVTQVEVEAELGPEVLLRALDKDKDGVADPDQWERLEAIAERRVNARLTHLGAPFADGSVPDAVADATLAVLLEMCARLGGLKDATWADRAKGAMAVIEKIAEGKLPLTYSPVTEMVAEPESTFSDESQEGL